jgi:hypothetical protein
LIEMERTARRSIEFPVLSRSEAGAESLSPRPAGSLREAMWAFEHLFGNGCGRGAVTLPNFASRVPTSILHAQPIRSSASFSERLPETMLASSSFREGRDRWAVEVFEAVVARGQRFRRTVCSGAFVSRVRRLKIRSASSEAARRSFSEGCAEAVEAPAKVSGAGSVALREASEAFEQRDPERWGPMSHRRPEQKRRKEGPSVQHSACSGRLSYNHERRRNSSAMASSNSGGLGPGAAKAQQRWPSFQVSVRAIESRNMHLQRLWLQ